MLNHEKLLRTLLNLRMFIDRGLALCEETHQISGFYLNRELLEAAMANTYLETVGDKADTLYRDVKAVRFDQITHAMLDVVGLLSGRFCWRDGSCVLAFDYTDEDFYGEVQGFFIHGWTGEGSVKGKFKFLTCSMVASSTGQRIPLLSIPIMLGHQMSKEVLYVLSLLKPLLGTVDIVLFDRGFYCKELIKALTVGDIQYLMFIPKNSQVKKELESMNEKEQKIQLHDFTYQKDKTTHQASTFQVFLKSVYNKRLDKEIDWTFATNINNINLDTIIQTYMQRWKIETDFRVQDEAKIKCKSTDMTIRYFLFIYEQLLQMYWGCFYQQETSFKRYLIELSKTCTNLVTKTSALPRVAAKHNA